MSNTYTQLLNAVSFAARAHDGQLRKDEKTPYASHPFRVCLIVRDLFGFDDPAMLQTALLHDTLEDTRTDFDDLEEQFDHQVAEWVALLSKDKRLQETDREQAYIQQLAKAPWQVQVCKLADICDNLTDRDTLPPDAKAHVLARMQAYVNALQAAAPHENLSRPLALVNQLLAEVRSSGG
jgi:(p)ppGpp synthase/HD superfamily hydrolase